MDNAFLNRISIDTFQCIFRPTAGPALRVELRAWSAIGYLYRVLYLFSLTSDADARSLFCSRTAGIPEWGIPSLDPALAIKGLSLNQGGGNTRLRATFKELEVSGLSNYTITYVK